MLTAPQVYDVPPAVRRRLDDARWRLRAYVWLEGLSLLVALVGAAFWLGLLLDWTFEPSPSVRRVALVVFGVAALYTLYHILLRRVFAPVSDASLAVLLERRFPELRDHVLTVVHVASSQEPVGKYHPDLIARTQHAAARAVADIDPGQLFDRRPLVRAVTAAAVAVVSIIVFGIASRDVFGFYVDRLALSPEPWPRRVYLEVVGFPPNASGNRTHKVAQDDPYELVVHARTEGYEVPDEVQIRYELSDGRRGRDTLIRVGDAVADGEEHQIFRYEFDRVAGDMSFDVVGGDDRVEDLHLKVVERPQLFSIELACEYPPYLGREPRHLPVTGGMRIPEGVRVALRAKSTKPLTAARIRTTLDGKDEVLKFENPAPAELAWEYGGLSADDMLLVTVTDVDGVSNREPYRVSLAMVPDELPEVAVRLAGIGTAITPNAVLPLRGKVTDDYGLNSIFFEYQVDDQPIARRPMAEQPSGDLTMDEFDRFDLQAEDEKGERALAVKPGQKLKLTIKATDRYDLADVPREGSSQQFVLDVVTEAELLSQIETRELELRRRFEAIYEKMTDMRNLLSRVDFAEVDEGNAAATTEAENGDEPSDAARALARRRLRVSGAERDVTQSADEVLAVAEGFDDIYDQLTNNRVDNPDLQSRLREQIARPLHVIGSEVMPRLTAQLELVSQHVANPSEGRPALESAISLADKMLVDMKEVLDRMLELETYNEVVALLRDIITDQQELNRRTKDRQTERLRSLLEE